MSIAKDNLIWLDLEMTGLDCQNDTILEIATIITDNFLEIIAEGPVIAIAQREDVLAAMDDWNTRTHGDSGLVQRVRESSVSMAEAERETLKFVSAWVPKGCSPMCGNSICQDRRFLYRLMPELENYFHYRNLDVSTIKELARRWSPEKAGTFCKNNQHQALADIMESIAELRHYSKCFLKAPEHIKQ